MVMHVAALFVTSSSGLPGLTGAASLYGAGTTTAAGASIYGTGGLISGSAYGSGMLGAGGAASTSAASAGGMGLSGYGAILAGIAYSIKSMVDTYGDRFAGMNTTAKAQYWFNPALQGIDGLFGGAVFGGSKYQQNGAGINLSADGNSVHAVDTASYWKKGGWFQGGSGYTSYADNASASSQLTTILNPLVSSLTSAAQSIGLVFDPASFKGTGTQINTLNKSSEAISQEVDAFIQKTLNEMAASIPGIEKLGVASADTLKTLMGLIDNLKSVNAVFALIGKSAMESTLNGAMASDSLVKLFGGMEGFGKAVDGYFTTMFTDTEQKARQAAQAQSQLNAAFLEIGITAPGTRQEFRNIVNGLDVTTAAGQKTFAALMNIAPAFGTVAAAAEKLIADQHDLSNNLTGRMFSLSGNKSGGDYYSMILAQEQELASAREKGVDVTLLQTIQERERSKWLSDGYTAAADNYNAAQVKIIDSTKSLISGYEATANAFRGVADTLSKMRLSLQTGALSALSPADQLVLSKQAMMRDYARGMAGDVGAMSAFSGEAQSYLQSAKGYYASSPQYAAEYDSVISMLQNGENMANQQVLDTGQQIAIQNSILNSLTKQSEDQGGRDMAQLRATMEGFKQLVDITSKALNRLENIESGLERQAATAG
jgi:hypothetical protein